VENQLAEFLSEVRAKAKGFTSEQRQRLEDELDDIQMLLNRGSIVLEDVLDEGEEILGRALSGEE
jgi:hypothetical protein